MGLIEEIPGLGVTGPEHLLLRAWRKVVFSQGACRVLGKEFDVADPRIIVDAIALFLKRLNQGSRHTLTVGHPGYSGITSDERQMLAVIAAGQAEDEALELSHLSWLVKNEHRAAVSAAARLLGRLLNQRGVYLPIPDLPPSSPHPMLTVVREGSYAP